MKRALLALAAAITVVLALLGGLQFAVNNAYSSFTGNEGR